MTGEGASGPVATENGLIITVSHGPFWDAKWIWLLYAALGAVAWTLQSEPLGWVVGVMAVMGLMTVWQRHAELRQVEQALASGPWQSGRLSQGLYDDDPCWDVVERPAGVFGAEGLDDADAAPADAAVWQISTRGVPLPSQEPFPIQFYNLDNNALVIRFGPHVVLSPVKSSPQRAR